MVTWPWTNIKAWFSLANVFVFVFDLSCFLFEMLLVKITVFTRLRRNSWSRSISYSTPGLVSGCPDGWPSCGSTTSAKKQAPRPKLSKRSQPLLCRSSPYYKNMWRRYCCLSFFPIVDTCLNCEDIAQQSCAMVPRWPIFGDYLGPVFSASRAQYISDLQSKFAHHVSKYGRHPMCGRWD